MKFLDVTLAPRKETKPEEVKEKAKYNWSYENSINTGKQPIDLDQPQEFKYNQWRTNTSLSNFVETIAHADNMNMAYHLSDKLHYHYLFYSVRKVKRYGKAKTEEEKRMEKEIKKEQELLALIQDYYKYNIVRAKEALRLLTREQIEHIRKKQEKGGTK